MAYPLSRYFFIPLFTSRIKVINGLENLPSDGSFLVVSNHISYLDPPLLSALVAKQTREKVHFITKQEIYRFFGNIIGGQWLGMIPVDPANKSRSLDVALGYLKKNGVIGIFPEGGRCSNGALRKGKTGAARLALWSKCPVIPVGFRGPADKSVKEAIRLFFTRKEEMSIEIGKPLDLREFYDREITYELLEEVTGEILRAIGKLCGKEYPY